ncbi:amino acid ABC transporter permease [Alicyclobacillus mengziensis]|uniref:Amino acid ABC transporter permease n=1 Tax=Alicyclobacillus mengziensis TaxID=2931921 RepID=A0A9X7Z6Q8_9BACL|nr:amino acid ABC transporter permease [Alicyclobacillus mengziensis]QSO47627.1 amino acid ABC transporter permease [Alicyclobacillus mengziensis]
MQFVNYAIKYLPLLLQGALVTLELTALGVLFGLVLGVIAALGRLSHFWLFNVPARLYTWIIRGTPLLVQILIIYVGLPALGITLPPFPAAVIALSVNSGAYITEIIRAGIQSIDTGQMEASLTLGMTYSKAMRRIIFPQAYRRLLPPLVNEFVALLKDSSLVSVISMEELLRRGQEIYTANFKQMQTLILVAILYLIMTSIFVFVANRLEKRLAVRG